MTLTSRIRLYLILIAVLPVMIVMLMIWYQLSEQSAKTNQRTAEIALARYRIAREATKAQLFASANRLAESSTVKRALSALDRTDVAAFEPPLDQYELSFAEIVDSNGIGLASVHRPGLLGQPINDLRQATDSVAHLLEAVEYDLHGPHAARIVIVPLKANRMLYCGRYINEDEIARNSTLLEAPISLLLEPDSAVVYETMAPEKLYRTQSGFEAVLSGSNAAQFYLIARFDDQIDHSTLLSLLGLAGMVGLVSVLASILVGLYITGRAKREIDNLVHATERVSQGDLNTPIMAYEEGEFSKLADSFSQMMVDLKRLQADLATTEKIAAWQTMGRKIAHEIKNPMTPIAISAEDLRRSYQENLPNFDQILKQTTGTIKNEVDRLTRLLDEFVGFARIPQPQIRSTSVAQLLDDLKQFYARELESARVLISTETTAETFPFDRDNLWQVLINLIKNGLESTEAARVTVRFQTDSSRMTILVEDNGPGFPDRILSNSFQPHISTKKFGSGLGLVICYRIIRDHNGQLEIYNRPEGGGAVKITLPA